MLLSSVSPPLTQVMAESTKEDLKCEGVLPTSSRGGGVTMFHDVEKRHIWRKLDIYLLPFVSLLYLMSFL